MSQDQFQTTIMFGLVIVVMLAMMVVNPIIVLSIVVVIFILLGMLPKHKALSDNNDNYDIFDMPLDIYKLPATKTKKKATPGSIIPRDINYKEDQKKLSQFMMMKRDYLSSSVWDKKRKAVLSRDNYTCQHCGTTGLALDIHHIRGYNLIPNEPLSCLVAICRSCHTEEHDLRGYPQTYQEYMTWGVN